MFNLTKNFKYGIHRSRGGRSAVGVMWRVKYEIAVNLLGRD